MHSTEFQDSLPSHLRHSRFDDHPGSVLRPHDIRISTGSCNQIRQEPRTTTISSQNSPTGAGTLGTPGTPPPKLQIDGDSQRERFEPGPTEERVWRPTRQITSPLASGTETGPRRNSGGHQVRFGDNSSESMMSSLMMSSERRSSDISAGSVSSKQNERRDSKSETTTVSQSDEELRTHGPSYTMFKLDDPQTESKSQNSNRLLFSKSFPGKFFRLF